MGALDQKYALAISAIRMAAKRRHCSFKEMVVRLASDGGLLNIPLFNEELDAVLIRRSEARAS